MAIVKGAAFRQLRRAGRHLYWLIQDCTARHRFAVFGAVVASVGGVLLQGTVLGILFTYARLLEKNQALRVASLTLDARSETALLMVGGMSLLCFAVSAALIYLAKAWIANVSVQHEQYCSRMVMERLSARPFQVIENHGADRIVNALLAEQTLNARGCGRAVQTLLGAAYPAVIAVYMLVFLAYIDAAATLIVLALFLLFAGAWYRLNVAVVDNEAQIKLQQNEFRAELRRLAQRLLPLNRIHANLGDRIEAAYCQPAVQGMFDRIRLRRISLARADLLGNVAIALALACALVWLGRRALLGEVAWGQVVVYVIALRFAVAGARSLLIATTALARWYPYVREFHHLTGRGQPVPAGVMPARLTVRNRKSAGDLPIVEVKPGDRMAVLSPVELTRFTFFHFMEALLDLPAAQRACLGQAADFVPARPAAHAGEPLRRVLHLPDDATWDDLRALVPDFSFVRWLEEWAGGNLDREVTPQGMRGLRRKKLVKLALFATAFRDDAVLFVDAGALAMLSERARARWFELGAGKILFIHYGTDFAAPGRYGELAVICGNRTGQCALGSIAWLRTHVDAVAREIGAGRGREVSAVGDDIGFGDEPVAGGL